MIFTRVFAWNSVGHRVIAQMAYDKLTPRSKAVLLSYNRALNHAYARRGFVESSVWLDQLYSPKLKIIRQMHYIDLPFTQEKTAINLPQPQHINVVWAIHQAVYRLNMQEANMLEKGIALRFILHLIGDIHQPLHAITRISSEYPQGDRGGNLVRLKHNHVANNLHAYWDRGAGLWSGKLHAKQVKQLASKLAQSYPCESSKNTLNPEKWAKESNVLAIKYAYSYSTNGTTSPDYMAVAQRVSARRAALAACRLAAVLNSIVDANA